MMHQNEGLRHW